MALGRDVNVRWFSAEESENVSAMRDSIPNMIKYHTHFAGYVDLSLGSIVWCIQINSFMFRMKLHFSRTSLLMIFLLEKLTSDVSILLKIPFPFAKLCEIDEHIRGQNLFRGRGEEETETILMGYAEDTGGSLLM
jgi:hypothetical protein